MILRGFLTPPKRPPARFPDQRVGYAVGDVHGRADLLERMLDALEARAEAETRAGGPPIVVFLGDYVDRGPDSRAVLDILAADRPRGFDRRFLKGNHEAAMLSFLADPVSNRDWVAFGGLETLASYGVRPPPAFAAREEVWRAAAEDLNESLPDAHRSFLEGLERFVELGGYAFVHAGVDPAKRLDDQSDADLMSIRGRFLNSRRPFERRVVHGHTPVAIPHVDERRIGLDTGAYASGRLSAARFEGEDVAFLRVSDGRADA